MMGRLFLIFIFPMVIAVLFFHFFHLKCEEPSLLKELAAYTYKEHKVPDFTSYIFKLKSQEETRTSSLKKTEFESLVKSLKISVIRGKKTYLLIGPIFLEEGKEYNGIKFIGVIGNKVLIEVGGKVYEKKL